MLCIVLAWLVRSGLCLLVYPWETPEERARADYLARPEFNVADGLRLWLASERHSFDRRTSGVVTVHAAAVVVNSYHIEGRHLPQYASDMLNATDIFTSDIHDDYPYFVIALRLDLLPWRMQLPRARPFCPAAATNFDEVVCFGSHFV